MDECPAFLGSLDSPLGSPLILPIGLSSLQTTSHHFQPTAKPRRSRLSCDGTLIISFYVHCFTTQDLQIISTVTLYASYSYVTLSVEVRKDCSSRIGGL